MKKLALVFIISCISFVSFAQITGPNAVCVGAVTTLTATPLSAGSNWSSTNNTIATIGSATGIVTGVAPGVDTILYPGGITGIPYFTHVITVNPLPAAIVGPDTVCIGATITLTDATTAGTWFSNTISVATVGSSIGAVAGVSAGAAAITFKDDSGCYTAFSVTVKACTTGAAEIFINNRNAEVYPNPVYDELTLKTYPGQYNSFVIVNAVGQVIQRLPLNSPQTTVDIRTLPTGLYYVLFIGENESKPLKFVKM